MARILEGRNAPSDSEAASFVDKYEEHLAEIEQLGIEHMNKCRAVRAKMTELLDDAKSQGVAKGDIKDAAKARALRKKLHELLTDREEDSQVKGILAALGDDFSSFGLGAAAVQREEPDENPKVDPVAAAAQAAWNDAAPKKGRAAKH